MITAKRAKIVRKRLVLTELYERKGDGKKVMRFHNKVDPESLTLYMILDDMAIKWVPKGETTPFGMELNGRWVRTSEDFYKMLVSLYFMDKPMFTSDFRR